MPSVSPGEVSPSVFAQILPGAPTESLQSLTTYTFRWKRYIVYISGRQLNILRSPTQLVQAITFDEELVAVKAEGEESGKIAVASKGHVWVLESQTDSWNHVTWRKSLLLSREDEEDETRSLSWGNNGEVLVGGTRQVSLYSVLPSSREGTPVKSRHNEEYVEERRALWSKAVPSPVQSALFSPTASLIASCGPRDRLVKIWRRLSFEEGLFDYGYLPHPAAVTHLEWRVPLTAGLEDDDDDSDDARAKAYGARNEEDQELLYTFCADGVLRVWRNGGPTDLDLMVLQVTVDLVAAIPHSPILTSAGKAPTKPTRYAFILPSGGVSGAVNAAIAKQQYGKVSHSIEHLREFSSRQPDVVVVLDGTGRMSAWGLQTIGHKRRPSTPTGTSKQAYHIAHAEKVDMKIPTSANARFESWFDGDAMHVLAHTFDGTVTWWRGNVEGFFSPAAGGLDRVDRVASWSGGVGELIGMNTSSSTALAWSSQDSVASLKQGPCGTLDVTNPLKTLADARSSKFLHASTTPTGPTLCVTDTAIILTQDSGKVFSEVPSPLQKAVNVQVLELNADDEDEESACYLIVDQSGAYATVTTSPSTNLQCGAEGSLTGLLSADATKPDEFVAARASIHPRKRGWLRLAGLQPDGVLVRRDMPARAVTMSTVNGTEAPLSFTIGISTPSKFEVAADLAAVSSSQTRELAIFDLKTGYVEHRQSLETEVKSLCFTPAKSDSGSRSMIAIARQEDVDILAAARYELVSSSEHRIWVHVKRISIQGIGLNISSVGWLRNVQLAIAAGNTLLVDSGTIAGSELDEELRGRVDLSAEERIEPQELAGTLCEPLVAWHPNFLQQLGARGRLAVAVGILKRLEQSLRFYTHGDYLHPTLEIVPSELLTATSDHQQRLDNETLESLKRQLAEFDLPRTSDTEQQRLKLVLDTVAFMQDHIGALDTNAQRYLFSWRLQTLRIEKEASAEPSASTEGSSNLPNGDQAPTPIAPSMSWRDIVFAYHSETQQPLLEILHAHYGNKMHWKIVKNLGIPAWLHTIQAAQSEGSDLASLEQIFDSLAQTSFRSVYPPDPTRASLYFLAMRKKATLIAIWRIAVGNREQKSTTNFLKRDFSAEENRTAARKNAYALMGKRRFEYAAAFFILADEPTSAIRILAGQCEDLLLAIAVARVYCGDNSTVMRQFLNGRILPEAKRTGDRWLMTWVHGMLSNRRQAADALVASMDHVQEQDDDDELKPRYWQHDDPLTLDLYRHLRDAPVKPDQVKKQTAIGGSEHEYRAVLRSARILRRMGLWSLALELVSTWTFKEPIKEAEQPETANGIVEEEAEKQAPSMLDDFTQLSMNDSAATSAPSEPAAPKSMLDDFGPTPAAAPKSMLDDFASPPASTQPVQGGEDSAKKEREAKAAELLAKLKAKKSDQDKEKGQEEAKKPTPTQFKEPAASSILDSFGF